MTIAISKLKDGYYVVSTTQKGADGNRKKLGGPYKTHKEAQKRFNQCVMFEHMNK